MLNYMKKCVILFAIVVMVTGIIGCGQVRTEEIKTSASNNQTNQSVSDELEEKENDMQTNMTEEQPSVAEGDSGEEEESIVYEKDFGTYTVDAQWVEDQTDDMYIYCKKGTEDDKDADLIMLGYYENPYSLDQIDVVYTGIEQQLQQNLDENGGGELMKGSYSTDQGYNLLIYGFSIEEVDVTQFYIVGEKKHCMVQTITRGESEERNKVIQDMINSFVWKE